MVNRINVPLMFSKSTGCYSPNYTLSLSHTAHLSIQDGASRSLWQNIVQLGKLDSNILSHFPIGEIIAQDGVSWQYAVPPCGRTDPGEETLPLILFNVLNLIFFFFGSNSVLELLCWTPGSKFVLLGREKTKENVYSRMLIYHQSHLFLV